MATQDYTWDLDPTGTNPANLIPGEIKNLSPANGPDFHFFIPDAAPYHENSMRIVHVATGRLLTKDVDWEPGWPFEAATNSYSLLPIWGCVVIKDRDLTGAFRIDYQTLGGEFTYDEKYLLKLLQNAMVDPRTTSWDKVTYKPVVYDPNDHLHHTTETGSYEALVASVDALRGALNAANSSALDLFRQHSNDTNNPHKTNLEQLGIARFTNVFRATLAQVLLGQDDINYVTSELVAKAIDESLGNFNPRLPSFDKTLVGLENVPNWPVAVREDLDNSQSSRLLDPHQVYYIVSKVIQALPLGQLQLLVNTLNSHIADYNNPHDVTLKQLGIELASQMTGSVGQIAYFNAKAGPFNMEADGLVNRMAIVHNDAELLEQRNKAESFAEVYNSWTRYSVRNNDLLAIPPELTGWEYDAANKRVLSSINSEAPICLVNPEKTSGDYVFEVEVSSTDADDDYIGIVLGVEVIDGKPRVLALFRSATIPEGGGGRMQLIYDINGERQHTLVVSDQLPSHANGWAGYQATGPIKLKAERVGEVLTVSSTLAGADYSIIIGSVNLRTYPTHNLSAFLGPVNLGYVAWSQAAATWKTLKRTGSRPIIAALHNGQVWEDDGTQYVQSPKSLRDVVKAGRMYVNPTTKRIYHCAASGYPEWLTGSSAYLDIATPSAIFNRTVYVNSANASVVGSRLDFFRQDPANNTMTPLGSLVRDATVTGVRSVGTDTSHSFMLGNEDGLKGGIKADDNGQVGFVLHDNSWVCYVDPSTRVIQHHGLNRLSDARVKDHPSDFAYDWEAVKDLELISWVWAEDDRVPEHMRGTIDSGVLAQKVQKAFPSCVKLDSSTGLLTVDDGKLSVHLGLAILKRLIYLENK
jgi:hypothetical protein